MAATLSGPSHRVDFTAPVEYPHDIPRLDMENDKLATPAELREGWSTVILGETIGRYSAGRLSHSAVAICYLKNMVASEATFNKCVEKGGIGRIQVVNNKIQSMFFGRRAIANMETLKIQEFMLQINEVNLVLDHKPTFSKIPTDDQYKVICSKLFQSFKEAGFL